MNKKIILVNMDQATADSLVDFLSKWGYTPVRTNNLEMMILQLQSSAESIIIFQFLEFKENEFTFFHAIREKFPNITIFATSPFLTVKESFKVARAGAVEYLMQPFDPESLKKILAKYTDSSSG